MPTKFTSFAFAAAMLLSLALCAGCTSQKNVGSNQYNCVENMNDYHCTGAP